MDQTSFKILETLSRELGTEMSINQLTERIRESYGSAYYANIYNKLQQLAGDNIVTIKKIGNTSIAQLNFDNYLIVDMLAQIEMQKKRTFLKDKANSAMHLLLPDLERSFRDDLPFVRSISVIGPERNQMINRAELLILVKGQGTDPAPEQGDAVLVHHTMKTLQKMHPIMIDYLMLTEANFLGLFALDEANPAREMLADKITLFGQQNFWHAIKVAAEKGIPLRITRTETIPLKMAEADLVYNMARFGYNEMGTKMSQAMHMCIEYVIAAMIAKGDARRIEAVPVLLAKNSVDYEMLIFISRKFKFAERLLGLLSALADIVPEKKDVQYAIRVMTEMGIKPEPADRTSILEKMRLYNAT